MATLSKIAVKVNIQHSVKGPHWEIKVRTPNKVGSRSFSFSMEKFLPFSFFFLFCFLLSTTFRLFFFHRLLVLIARVWTLVATLKTDVGCHRIRIRDPVPILTTRRLYLKNLISRRLLLIFPAFIERERESDTAILNIDLMQPGAYR